ncbi:MAG: ankyrin repeat domain-containing protein [Thermoguttaceae bacterium]|nr:ankyrin repeat domain-containing protein [Thermoguttaceae bacterium]
MSPEYAKKITKNLAWEAFDQMKPFLKKGRVDEALDVLRRLNIGPKTIYGENGRAFCKLVIDYADDETGALKAAYLELMSALLDAGVDVDRQDKYSQTLLNEALDRGDLAICRLLLDRGASTEITNEYGETPLFDALRWFDANDEDSQKARNAPQILEAVILAGADVDRPLVDHREADDAEPHRWGSARRLTARQYIESLPEDDARRRAFFAALEKRDAAKKTSEN